MAQLDGIDVKILDLLQNDASQSIADIAERVHLSQNACWRRIKQLEEEGIIAKRVALLDPKKLGVGVTVFVTVRAGEHTERWLETFSAAVRKMPDVTAKLRVTTALSPLPSSTVTVMVAMPLASGTGAKLRLPRTLGLT